MSRTALALGILLAACPLPTVAATTDAAFHYIDPSQIDLSVLLPPPPDAGTAEARADEAEVAAAVAARSSGQLAGARGESARTVFFFAPSIDARFSAARLPVTARFFARVGSDVKKLIDRAKAHWQRARPDGVSKKRGAYPSGHAAFASCTAILLGKLLPAKRSAIFAQARRFALNRIVLGLHYPSDIAAGWTAGTLAAYVMLRNPAFGRDFATVQAELQRAGLVAGAQGT
jgi:acid phosphatase (class A)